jgi:hypothetical protein
VHIYSRTSVPNVPSCVTAMNTRSAKIETARSVGTPSMTCRRHPSIPPQDNQSRHEHNARNTTSRYQLVPST